MNKLTPEREAEKVKAMADMRKYAFRMLLGCLILVVLYLLNRK
jgi:hypothetical protein